MQEQQERIQRLEAELLRERQLTDAQNQILRQQIAAAKHVIQSIDTVPASRKPTADAVPVASTATAAAPIPIPIASTAPATSATVDTTAGAAAAIAPTRIAAPAQETAADTPTATVPTEYYAVPNIHPHRLKQAVSPVQFVCDHCNSSNAVGQPTFQCQSSGCQELDFCANCVTPVATSSRWLSNLLPSSLSLFSGGTAKAEASTSNWRNRISELGLYRLGIHAHPCVAAKGVIYDNNGYVCDSCRAVFSVCNQYHCEQCGTDYCESCANKGGLTVIREAAISQLSSSATTITTTTTTPAVAPAPPCPAEPFGFDAVGRPYLFSSPMHPCPLRRTSGSNICCDVCRKAVSMVTRSCSFV